MVSFLPEVWKMSRTISIGSRPMHGRGAVPNGRQGHLEDVGHPQAARIRAESDAYRKDLINGFEKARQYSPLVKLLDGRWVPNYPSRLYRRGRDGDGQHGWIREVLEGSVNLLISGLYDSTSKQAGWILDDYQDNRYPDPSYSYSTIDKYAWFYVYGFSWQPNLLAGLMPYLDRDEPDVYIWMFFNAWASCYHEEINGFSECADAGPRIFH